MTLSNRSPSLRTLAQLCLLGVFSAPLVVVAQAATPTDLATSISHADVARGRAIASAQCGICHSFANGGPSLIGPDLYGVVGRPIATVPNYSYSAALSAKKGVWTDASLDAWLAAPSKWAPGTKMGYAGLDGPARRADVIAYLTSQGRVILPSK